MEQSFVAWAKVRAGRLPKVKLGIGDDAAILAAHSEDTVITTDMLMDGVHFHMSEASPASIGRKLVNVSLSDLAAMAAEPEAVFLSLCLPPKGPNGMPRDILAAEMYEAVCDICELHWIAIAGGDTNCWEGALVVQLTAVGRVVNSRIWTRSGAKPNDLIVVTGPLGGSILGKHLNFEPRLDVARAARNLAGIHAAMDISDGFCLDLLRMCDASRCGAIVELDKVPISQAAQQLAISTGKSPLVHAMEDGEDFELLLAVAPQSLNELKENLSGICELTVCGQFTSRTGLWSRRGAKLQQLPAAGFVHGQSTFH